MNIKMEPGEQNGNMQMITRCKLGVVKNVQFRQSQFIIDSINKGSKKYMSFSKRAQG